MSLLFPPLLATAPAAVQWYLATSLIFTSVQSAGLRNDNVRSVFGLSKLADVSGAEPTLAKEFLGETERNMRAAHMQQEAARQPPAGMGVLRPEFWDGQKARAPSIQEKEVIITDSSGMPTQVVNRSIRIAEAETATKMVAKDTPVIPPYPAEEIMAAANRGEKYQPIVIVDDPAERRRRRKAEPPEVLNMSALCNKKTRVHKAGRRKKKGETMNARYSVGRCVVDDTTTI